MQANIILSMGNRCYGMSISKLMANGREIIYLDLEGVENLNEKIEHIKLINYWITAKDKSVLVLVNLKGFMADHKFMEYASSSILLRAPKIRKAAYSGMEKINQKAFSYFDKYNKNIVTRKAFGTKEEAIMWLTAD
jgi:hypothetical protein